MRTDGEDAAEPMLARQELARTVAELRTRAGLTHDEVGAVSRTTMSGIESARMVPRVGTILEIARALGASPEETETLVALTEGARTAGWWEAYGRTLPSWAGPDRLGMYVGRESAATAIQSFSPDVVHGLLQTRDYALAVIGIDERLDASVVEQLADYRMQRQRVKFAGERPARITAYLGEGALQMVVGSPTIMAAQLAHLRALAADPSTSAQIRVLPFAAGPHASLRGAFTILDFHGAEQQDRSLICIETLVGAYYLEQPAQLAEYHRVLDLLQSKSVPIEEYKE